MAQWKQFAASIQNEKEIILICVVHSCLLNDEENFARESWNAWQNILKKWFHFKFDFLVQIRIVTIKENYSKKKLEKQIDEKYYGLWKNFGKCQWIKFSAFGWQAI